MVGILKKTLGLLVGDPNSVSASATKISRPLKKLSERELLREESKVGSTLFGPIPKGHSREFFCLDETTWIWHEEWNDERGIPRQSTIRYEVHPNGILKVMDGARYRVVEGEELDNLLNAAQLYYERVARGIYHQQPNALR